MTNESREVRKPIVTFHRIFQSSIPPMRADKSALGSLPAAAFQYCEAIRAASSFGWYIFPMLDVCLRWDGRHVSYLDESNERKELTSIHLPEELWLPWDENAPDDLKGCRVPVISSLFVPGIVQIWSGLLVSTSSDWSILARPLANCGSYGLFSCYEGIVESDQYRPCPLFINIKLLKTDTDIHLYRNRPLFQVQPISRESYSDHAMGFKEYSGMNLRQESSDVGMSAEDWDGIRETIRSTQAERISIGKYGAKIRKKRKSET